MIAPDLARAARDLAGRPAVLVGLDFDGVLSPLVLRREEARPLPGTIAAVRRLAGLAGVEVALVSGRALESLREASGVGPEDAGSLSLVGSHGSERSLRAGLGAGGPEGSGRMTSEQAELLDRVVGALEAIADASGDAGIEVEVKPTGAVLHTRRADPVIARQAEQEAVAGPGTWPGVHVTVGKSVVELAVVETSKGVALQQLRALVSPDAVLYVGDDATDETAFAVLGPDDVGVKVGPGDTHAAYRLDGPPDVLELLQLLVAERSQR
jgi:trehalose 6-phosphate phosphatase